MFVGFCSSTRPLIALRLIILTISFFYLLPSACMGQAVLSFDSASCDATPPPCNVTLPETGSAGDSTVITATLTVNNDVTGTDTTITASGNQPWLTVTAPPPNSPLASGGSVLVTIQADPSQLDPSGGSPYQGTITVTPASGASISATVFFTVIGTVISVSPPAYPLTTAVGQSYPGSFNVVQTDGGTDDSLTLTGGAAWFVITNSTVQSTPASYSYQVNTNGLGPGQYTSTTTISCNGSPCRPKTFTLTLSILSPTTITVDHPSVSLMASAGSMAAPYSLTLSNSGAAGTYTTSVTSGPPGWLSITPSSGSVGQTGSVQLTIQADATTLQPNNYSGVITITGGSSTTSVGVSLTVTPARAVLKLDSVLVNLLAVPGAQPAPAHISVSSSDSVTAITFSISSPSASWLRVQAGNNKTTPSVLTLTADASALTASTTPYSATVTLVPANGAQNVIITVTLLVSLPVLSIVSAADFETGAPNGSPSAVAPDMIVTAFGTGLASQESSTLSTTLPTSLADRSISIRDSSGTASSAGLFYVGPGQINFEVPQGLAEGPATITLTGPTGKIATGTMTIQLIAPGLFNASRSTTGPAAGLAVRATSTGQVFSPLSQCDTLGNNCVALPIDLTQPGKTYLELFGTGIQHNSGLSNVKCFLQGVDLPPGSITYAGSQNTYPGLDQVNILLPNSLAGNGLSNLYLVVDGVQSNTIQVMIR